MYKNIIEISTKAEMGEEPNLFKSSESYSKFRPILQTTRIDRTSNLTNQLASKSKSYEECHHDEYLDPEEKEILERELYEQYAYLDHPDLIEHTEKTCSGYRENIELAEYIFRGDLFYEVYHEPEPVQE